MTTQDQAQYLVSHSHHDHRVLWMFVVVLSSLTFGLLPVINFLNVSVAGNTIPHEAAMWGAVGEQVN